MPRVIAGLAGGGRATVWYGWDVAALDWVEDVEPASSDGRRLPVPPSPNAVGVYPTWPIGRPPGQGVSFGAPAQSAAFFESGGATFLLMSTYPLTVWKITPVLGDADANPLSYVGALCTPQTRWREALVTRDNIYWVGDGGAVAVPVCSEDWEKDGCCPLP